MFLVQYHLRVLLPVHHRSQGWRIENKGRNSRSIDSITIQVVPQGSPILVVVPRTDWITGIVVAKDDFVGILDGRGGLVGIVCGEGGRGVNDGREAFGGHGRVVGHCAGRGGRSRREVVFGKVIRVFLMHSVRDPVDAAGVEQGDLSSRRLNERREWREIRVRE